MAVKSIAFLGLLAFLETGAFAEPETFCQRLASQLNMKQVDVRASQSAQPVKEWKVNLLGGLGPALFGGSVVMSFSVQALEDAEVSEHRRLQHACEQAGNEVACRVEGPATLIIGAGKGKVAVEAAQGERAQVGSRKTTIYCREG